MTTRPSSSHRGSPQAAAATIEMHDAVGQAFLLADMIGKGGEGSVFAVEGHPALAAKIYHQTPIAGDDLLKLQSMARRRSPRLDAIAAWPRSLLFAPRGKQPSGVLMARIADARPLHELYGTANRRGHFPEAKWHHLVLAARNVAAAFDTVHAEGLIVGDVNQGNLLVDQNMCVRFIDCDSFQIDADGKTFHCPVGTPHFTPPELQNQNLRDVARNFGHDRFGLAVLLFHLLFVGRHPFAGRFFGQGDLSIERAIAERRFAFSNNKAATLVEPPPASLLLSDLPSTVGALFERAFRAGAGPGLESRPAAAEWVQELDALIKQRKTCTLDPSHIYYNQLSQCPWCRIEDEGGPAFFVALDGSTSYIARDQLKHLEGKLRHLAMPAFAHLPAQALRVPQVLAPKRAVSGRRWTKPDFGAAILVVSAAACLGGAFSLWAVAAGTVGGLVGASLVVYSEEGQRRRRTIDKLAKRLVEFQRKLSRQAKSITDSHRKREAAFRKSVEEIQAEYQHFRAADASLQDVLAVYRATQKNRFLARHLIEDHAPAIRGMTSSRAAVLQSYGIESALDVDSVKLLGVPMLSPGLTLDLIGWRQRIEREFVFRPEHGVDFNATTTADAVKRFKIGQARRILMGARQLDSLAAAAGQQLSLEVQQYEGRASTVRELAAEIRDEQSARSNWERALNRKPEYVFAVAVAAPLIGIIVGWLFGA